MLGLLTLRKMNVTQWQKAKPFFWVQFSISDRDLVGSGAVCLRRLFLRRSEALSKKSFSYRNLGLVGGAYQEPALQQTDASHRRSAFEFV